MAELFSKHQAKVFAVLVIVFQLAALGMFAGVTEVNLKGSGGVTLYNYYGVAVMMLVGFGYLMTFLRWYGVGAVGLTMLVTCIGMELSMWLEPMFSKAADIPGFDGKIRIDLMNMLNANFAVAAFLISFGGLIGKVNPTQLVVLVILEDVFFTANKCFLLVKWIKVVDCGATIVCHTFGAYFGLAVSAVLGVPKSTEKETNSPTSDLFSMLGTAFLWLYWPSFVGGALPAGSQQADLAVTNTVLALLGSSVMTFALSPLMSGGKIRPVDVQNATLAGGVAIGAVANLKISPFLALLIGSLAGTLSTFGFCKVQDVVMKKLRIHDTCGINNLHGMPSILGAVFSAIVPALIDDENEGKPAEQLLALVVTLVVSITTGLITGAVLKVMRDGEDMADDSAHWDIEHSVCKPYPGPSVKATEVFIKEACTVTAVGVVPAAGTMVAAMPVAAATATVVPEEMFAEDVECSTD